LNLRTYFTKFYRNEDGGSVLIRNCTEYGGIGIATGWTAGVRFRAKLRDFSLFHSVETGSGSYPALYPMGIAALSPGRGTDQLHIVLRSRMVEVYLHSAMFIMAQCLIN
jgi:hypothetical protein